MKNITYLIMLAFFFAIGCNQAPSTSPSGAKTNDPRHPTNNSTTDNSPNAVFDIPTPSITGAAISAGSVSGHMVCLTWNSNTPSGTYAGDATATSSDSYITPTVNYGHDWEYWGTSQLSIVGPTSVNLPSTGNTPYSGHYEVWRINPDNTETDLPDITADGCCDDNLADGTYTYYIKSKSLEGREPNSKTHHSDPSTGYSVTITSCTEVAQPDTYPIVGVAGGNGSWDAAGTTWTTNSSTTSQNKNILFNINHFTNTKNSCTNVITSTFVDAYTGALYLSMDGGANWRTSLAWALNSVFQSNGTGPTGGNGSGFGKPGVGTYTVIYSTSASLAGQLGTFQMVVTP